MIPGAITEIDKDALRGLVLSFSLFRQGRGQISLIVILSDYLGTWPQRRLAPTRLGSGTDWGCWSSRVRGRYRSCTGHGPAGTPSRAGHPPFSFRKLSG